MWMLNFEPMLSMHPHPVFTRPCFPTIMELQMHKTVPVSGMVPWDQEIQRSLRWQQGQMITSSPCLKKFFFSGLLYFPSYLKASEGLVFISSFKTPHPTSWKVRKAQVWNKSVRAFSSCETHPDETRSSIALGTSKTQSPRCLLHMKIRTTRIKPSCTRHFMWNISKYHHHYFEANQWNAKGTK